MKTEQLETGGLPPGTENVECVDTPSDETRERRADIGRALHGIFTERFGTRVADRVMPSADKLARFGSPTSPPNSAPQKKKRRHPKPKRSPARSSKEKSLTSHEARCTICSHSERAAIEEGFLHWENCWALAREYGVNRRAIYRHAHAFNLFALRNRNLRHALGFLVEEVDRVAPTADAVLRAILALAHVNDEGQWVEPPSHVVVSRGPSPATPEAVSPGLDAHQSTLPCPSTTPKIRTRISARHSTLQDERNCSQMTEKNHPGHPPPVTTLGGGRRHQIGRSGR